MFTNISSSFARIGAIVALVAFAGVALAHAPIVTIDPIGSQDFATFPQIVDVTGTVTHVGNGNINGVNDIKLFINGVQHGAEINPNVPGNPTSVDFSLPWTILGPGTYEVMVEARHGNGYGSGSEEVEVTQTVLPPIVITECPAAPAIAGQYMRSNNIRPNSKTFSNVIKLVAAETGSKGSLWAGNACDAGYEAAVKAFVDDLLE